ncbi:transcription factor A, mitochondrial [Anopheles maculipalpis]|uniref:transcription factor A, mitochondrial n=1 Tax=Anopheles maculipalpis TaxID=1496333 RepID=UPI00215959DE|nr:transcription factor A, mitochondrial [Anopheles maculipalpis]
MEWSNAVEEVTTPLQGQRRKLSSWQTGSLVSAQSAGLHLTPSLNVAASIPEKPKRPMNAYIRFVQGIRSSLASANPNASPTDISKLAAVKWQSLDQASKAKYEEEYKREQAVWLQKNAKYLSQLTDAQKEEIKHERQQRIDGKMKREQKRALKELGRPKRPMNGYLRFCAQNKPVLGLSKEDNKIQMKNLGMQWRRLTDAEKERYNKEAEADMKRYQEKMKQWEDKMLAAENVDAVRKKNVLLPPSPASLMAKKAGMPVVGGGGLVQKPKKSAPTATKRP